MADTQGSRMVDELAIYRQQGFAQTLGIGQAPAVVVVDLVVGFTDLAQHAVRPCNDRNTSLADCGLDRIREAPLGA